MRVLIGLLIALTLFSGAFAESFQTANTVGQGKWQILGGYGSESNFFVGTPIPQNLTATIILGQATYGLSDKFDVILSAGQWSITNLPSGDKMDNLMFGASGKLALAAETANLPAVSGQIGYKMLNQSSNAGIASSGTQLLLGFNASKQVSLFNLYGAANYRINSFHFNMYMAGTQIDLTFGSAFDWSKQGSVYVEYTTQIIYPTFYDAYTNGQIGVGVGYKL